jgi:hypothetical protein
MATGMMSLTASMNSNLSVDNSDSCDVSGQARLDVALLADSGELLGVSPEVSVSASVARSSPVKTFSLDAEKLRRIEALTEPDEVIRGTDDGNKSADLSQSPIK